MAHFNGLRRHVVGDTFVYSAVLKVATTSIHNAIAQHLGIQLIDPKKPHLNHQWLYFTTQAYRREIGDERFHFSFVRNPWDRVVSYYQMRMEQGDYYGGNFTRWVFAEFMRGLVRRKIEPHLAPQLTTLAPMPDFVGRLETIEEDWEYIRERTGLPALTHKNYSHHEHYSAYYIDSTRTLVKRFYQEEIDLFGFEFEERDNARV